MPRAAGKSHFYHWRSWQSRDRSQKPPRRPPKLTKNARDDTLRNDGCHPAEKAKRELGPNAGQVRMDARTPSVHANMRKWAARKAQRGGTWQRGRSEWRSEGKIVWSQRRRKERVTFVVYLTSYVCAYAYGVRRSDIRNGDSERVANRRFAPDWNWDPFLGTFSRNLFWNPLSGTYFCCYFCVLRP